MKTSGSARRFAGSTLRCFEYKSSYAIVSCIPEMSQPRPRTCPKEALVDRIPDKVQVLEVPVDHLVRKALRRQLLDELLDLVVSALCLTCPKFSGTDLVWADTTVPNQLLQVLGRRSVHVETHRNVLVDAHALGHATATSAS